MSKKKKAVIKAIVLAGGYSRRMRSACPKQLMKIKNRPLLAYTLDVFEQCPAIDNIILVINEQFLPEGRSLVESYGYRKVEKLCIGGKTRQQSAFNGLQTAGDCDYVVIHDAVRPLVSPELILKITKAVKKFGAVTCAVKATDTIVQAKGNFIDSFLRRHQLWHIQTPQAFKFDLISQAHNRAKAKKISNASDDTQLLVDLKIKVRLIEGNYKNIKVTTMPDLCLVKELMHKH